MSDDPESVPVHPGRILLERVMQPLGISRNQLARDIDVPVGRISDLTNGKRGITADTAMRLGRYFGVPPQLWLRLQAEYDLHVVRTTTWHDIESRVRILDSAKALAGLQLVPERTPAVRTEAPPASSQPATPTTPEPVEIADPIGIPPVPADDET